MRHAEKNWQWIGNPFAELSGKNAESWNNQKKRYQNCYEIARGTL